MTNKGRQGYLRFITTEAISSDGEENNQKVWKAARDAFSSRSASIGYWGYPLFLQVGDRRKEPDILIVDQEWGIIIIEVCTATIEQVNFADMQSYQPLKNASNYVHVLRKYCDREPSRTPESDIENKVIGRALIAFPYISTEQWQQRGWQGIEDSSPFIFNNQLGEVGLRKRIEQAIPVSAGQPLNDNQYKSLLSVISGISILRKQLPIIESHEGITRYNILAEAQNLMYEWDVKQEWIGKSIPPGPQRVRGIAGSGKTILFTQKAAFMHLKHPEWKIAFVFFTRSLYEQIEGLFKLWIDRFTNGEVQYQNSSACNLRVLHSWGSQDRDGLYREICQAHNQTPLGVNNTSETNPNRALADICGKLQTKTKIIPLFDAIVIDEGQDLVTEDDLKIKAEDGEEKQAIYWLAYQALKPVSNDDVTQKRLIWAYDEAQTLHSKTAVAPKADQVFGKNLSSMIGGEKGGIYPGGIRKGYDMERCYRTPGSILTTAYALGTGLLRTGGIIKPDRMRKDDFQRIGFEVVKGDFRRVNDPITISRPEENSPNPVSDLWNEPVIEFETYASREEELCALVEKIKSNLREDKLHPSRNLLVITLGYTTPPSYEGNNLETEVAKLLIDYGIDIYIPSALRLNDTRPRFRNNNPDLFWSNRGVTISRIDRTKGNEADMVYVVGLDNIAKNESDPALRNQLFVALTRSRGWVNLSGIGHYPMYDEVKKVIEQGNSFTFTIKGVTPSEDANEELTEEDEQNL